MTRLVSKESKKRKRFAELGIDYEFPGYAALKSVEQDKTEKKLMKMKISIIPMRKWRMKESPKKEKLRTLHNTQLKP